MFTMAKKKAVHTEPESAIEPQEVPVEAPKKQEPAPVAASTEPPRTADVPKAPKRRIRIRKKATKKLSAAIICMDPSIKRFI